MIKEKGEKPNYHIAETPQEYDSALLNKMIEELEEFRDNPGIEEAADMYEVWSTILDRWSLDMSAVISFANKKKKEKGGFFDGYILKIESEEENDWDVTPFGEKK